MTGIFPWTSGHSPSGPTLHGQYGNWPRLLRVPHGQRWPGAAWLAANCLDLLSWSADISTATDCWILSMAGPFCKILEPFSRQSCHDNVALLGGAQTRLLVPQSLGRGALLCPKLLGFSATWCLLGAAGHLCTWPPSWPLAYPWLQKQATATVER